MTATANGSEVLPEAEAPPVVDAVAREYAEAELTEFAVRLGSDPFIASSWSKLERLMMDRAFRTEPAEKDKRESWYGVAKCVEALRKEIERVAAVAKQNAARSARLKN